MATRLDRQIEQIANIVEKRLDLCDVMWNGIRCTLPANHEQKEPHSFPIDFSYHADPAESASPFAGDGNRDFTQSDTLQK